MILLVRNQMMSGLKYLMDIFIILTLYPMPEGIFKKKLNSDENEIKLSSDRSSSISVLGDYIYYINITGNKIIRMDLNGNNSQTIDSGDYSKIWVAGYWIFYKTQNNRLYMIRTDGSEKRLLNPSDKFK